MARRHPAWTFSVLAALALIGCESSKEMTIKGLNPQTGHVAGDQTVEIRGETFRTDIGYTVYFGQAKAKAVTIRSTEALAVTTPSGDKGPVDVTVRSDDGRSFKIKQGFRYEDMGGSVVEGLGTSGQANKKGNLAF
jgi:hypothetical protein